MGVEVQVGTKRGNRRKMSEIRVLLEKAGRGGLTPTESIFLRGEIARLESRVATVNSRVGREVVQIGPYARLIAQTGSSPAIAL